MIVYGQIFPSPHRRNSLGADSLTTSSFAAQPLPAQAPGEKRGRVVWIDCAKLIAILAVLVDHCNKILYDSEVIFNVSHLSICMFVFLSGLSLEFSRRGREPVRFSHQLRRIGSIFLQYALATTVYYTFYTHRFDLEPVLDDILHFSAIGPFYFLAFFFQLLLIAPLLMQWCRFCHRRRLALLWHTATLLALACMSSWCLHSTSTWSLWGAGKCLFGGSFLLVYYLGILFGQCRVFDHPGFFSRPSVLAVSVLAWLCWAFLLALGRLPFDSWLSPWFGDYFSPPTLSIIVSALLMCFACCSFFTLLEKYGWGKGFVKACCYAGRDTLYIFMYHLLVRDLVLGLVPDNVWLMRFTVFPAMLLVPLLLVFLARKLRQYVRE